MSAKIWMDIRDAVIEVRPELGKEFELCRDKESIITFLNENFPLDPADLVPGLKWEHKPMTQVPDILREVFSK